MKLVRQIISEAKRQHWWTSRTTVVVAVSTGVDSMTLLHLLTHLGSNQPRLVVAHVNHELRTASWHEERYLRSVCHNHHLKLVVAHWRKVAHPDHGIENAARQFRYRFFKRVMRANQAAVLVTAHHLNDQAETVLMRLIRGGDIHELTGIHPVRPFAGSRLIRPLLTVPKARLVDYAKAHRIKYFTDATNASLAMTRNRMRHVFLPRMARENPRVVRHLGRYAAQLRWLIRDNHLLNMRLVKPLRTGLADTWRLLPLLKWPRFVQLGIIRALLTRYYPELLVVPAALCEIIKLFNDDEKPQGQLRLGHHLIMVKSYRCFKLISDADRRPVSVSRQPIEPNRWYRLGRRALGVFSAQDFKTVPVESHRPVFFLSKAAFPLWLRRAHPSDRIRLKSGGHQKVRRILINQKIPNYERERARFLETNQHVGLALLGYKTAFLPKRNRETEFRLMTKD